MKRNIYISGVVFLCVVAAFWLGYWIFGFDLLNLNEYCRWDSGLYLGIAERGYWIEYKWSDYYNTYVYEGFCGWYYLYPMLIKGLSLVVGIDLKLSGIIVSFVFTFMLICISLELINEYKNKYLLLICLVIFPGWTWLFSVFPMSMTLFFLVANIYYLHRGRYFASGFFGFLASASYSTAFLICGVDLIYIIYTEIFEKTFEWKTLMKNIFLTPVISFLGFVSFHVILFLKTGYWNAFFLTQKKYGHGLHNPINTCINNLKIVLLNNDDRFIGFINVVIFMYMIVLCVVYIKKRYIKDKYMTTFFSWGVMVYIFMLVMGGGVAPMRQYLLMSISVFIFKDCKVIYAGLLVFLLVFYISSWLFLGSVAV